MGLLCMFMMFLKCDGIPSTRIYHFVAAISIPVTGNPFTKNPPPKETAYHSSFQRGIPTHLSYTILYSFPSANFTFTCFTSACFTSA